MHLFLTTFLILGIGLFMPADVHARDLSELIEDVLRNNPRVLSAEKDANAVKARIPQASALPDPMFKYSFMGEMLETRLGPQEDMIEIEQEIPFPGKLTAKRRMASAEFESATADFEAVTRDVIFQTRSAAYDLWAVNRRLELLRQMRDWYAPLAASRLAGYAGGESSQKEALMTQSDLAMIAQDIAMLERQKDTLQAQLQALLNTREELSDFDVDDGIRLPEQEPALEDLLARLDANPDLRRAESMVKRETHGLKLARQDNRPDIKIGFQYIGIGDDPMITDPDVGRDAWAVPVTISLPIWQNRIRAGIREAKNGLESAEAMRRQTGNEITFELKRAYYEYVSQKKVTLLYRDALIPQAEAASASEEAGYESGGKDLEAWVLSRRRLLEMRAMYAQALAQTLKSFAEIEKITGDISDKGHDL